MKKISFKSIFTVIISAVIMLSICTFNSQSIETEAYGSKSRDYWIYTRSNHLTKDYTLTQSDSGKYITTRSFVDGVDDRETSTLSRYVSGCVQFNYWDGTEWCNSGDGFIVGDNVIATAAHVVAYKGEVKELNKSNTNYIYIQVMAQVEKVMIHHIELDYLMQMALNMVTCG
ncbi:MAG TPA: hypothetical protein DIW26_02020 [Ruminococcus sp.]|nr:hypothetical protein [Ruminococcus sp.]HCR73197.1 hypothetical protein [Ruminococcus sp.]